MVATLFLSSINPGFNWQLGTSKITSECGLWVD
jgi:hypothetical protein